MMDLWLTHGRDDRAQEMDSSGYDGPVLTGVDSVQQMYGEVTTVGFASPCARDVARARTGWDIWDEVTLEVRDGDDGLIEIRPSNGAARQLLCELVAL